MNVTPTDNVDELIRQAQAAHDNNVRITRFWENLHNIHNKERTRQEQLNSNREMMMLDKLYYEKARTKSVMVKGTNVDLYI